MAINFPDSPTAGQKVTLGGRRYKFSGGAWVSDDSVALPRQRLVNPSMRIMQEYQNISTGALATGDYHAADQWQVVWSTGSALINSTLLAPDPTHPAYPSQTIQLATTAAYPTVGASEHLQIRQIIEDVRLMDMLTSWGTANAKGIIVRFWMWCTYAGTYTLKVADGSNAAASTRSYVTPIYYPNAATWQQFTIAIPGDTGGTWPNGTFVPALMVDFVPRIGSTYQTPLVNTWIAGDFYGVIGSNNFTALGASTFLLSQVEMYVDPQGSGIAPRYVMRTDAEELRACQRYWYRAYSLRGTVNAATRNWGAGSRHPNLMRGIPTASLRGAVRVYDGLATAAVSALTNWSGFDAAEFYMDCPGGLTIGRVGMQYITGPDDYIAISSRM
jgi:hypothetical protein